jgi:cytochrome c-type biogenesis protein CcmH
VRLLLERADVIALNNNRQFIPEARELVLKAYALEPGNANVLWFAGVAEYQHGNYHQAIQHLTRLLPLAKGEDDVIKSLTKVIIQSRQQLIAAGEKVPELEELLGTKAMASDQSSTTATSSAVASITRLQIAVDVSDEVRQKFDAGDVVFVYAKAKQGPRMPLAAQRMTLAELPATVVLDDNMAMVDGMNLSAFEQLVVSARVTKTGAAIAQSGDFIGRIDVVDKKSSSIINVVIDTAIP